MRARWAWVAVALGACSSPSPCSGLRSKTIGSGVGLDQACADWATHYCNRLESCAPMTIESAYGEVARCIARNRPVCVSALKATSTGDRPSKREACAQAYDSASCDDVVVGKPPESCRVAGSLPAGAACGDSAQCQGAGGYCKMGEMGDDRSCGTCALLGEAGAACDSSRDCAFGLVCYFTCMPPVGPGAACDGMRRQCPETLICFDYACSAPAARGAPCNPHADNCDRDHGLYCDPQVRACSPYTPAEIGAPCGAGTICKAGSCATMAGAGVSRCVANAADESECEVVDGPSCLAPARCVSGVCKVPDASKCP